MLHLRDDGTVGIDLDDGNGTTVELRRPTVGQWRYLWEQMLRFDREETAAQRAILDAEDLPDQEKSSQLQQHSAARANLRRSWEIILSGDGSFPGLAAGPVPDLDDFPMWLLTLDALRAVREHFESVPLARGVRSELSHQMSVTLP